MRKELPDWCKRVKIKLIENDMSIQQLADNLGKSRVYVSGIVHGRTYSKPMIDEISNFLNIKNDYK